MTCVGHELKWVLLRRTVLVPEMLIYILFSANIGFFFRLNVVFFVILQSFIEYNKNHYNERFIQMA